MIKQKKIDLVPLPNAKSIERKRVHSMVHSYYVSPNGEKIPYVPVNIQTNRDAYEATLHVLFKHVADFHLCMIKVFSQKYGIPEDDIINTIRESQEFKNMQVNPALTMHDSLGYLSQPASQPAEQPAEQPQTQPQTIPVVKKRIVKKKSTDVPVAAPVVAEAAPVVAEAVHEAVATVRKTVRKSIPKIPANPMIPANPPDSLRLQEDIQAPITEAPIGKKIIKKKTLSTTTTAPAPAPASEPITQFKDVIATTADASPMQKKVIRKKK